MFCITGRKSVRYIVAVTLILCFSLLSSQAQAHDFWINATASMGTPVDASIGYGHDFPNPEPIAESRFSLFDPLQLMRPEGSVSLQQKGENYAYQGSGDLARGSYVVAGTYLPTFWSKGPGGWAQSNRQERPDATYCEEVTMFAKTVLSVGGDTDKVFISRPIGQRLELVPLVHPATVSPGGTFPVQVLLDGKRLKLAEVTATFDGFSKNKEHKAFQGRCDLKGVIDIVTLRGGYWFVKVKHVESHQDPKVCDEVVLISTLTFHIPE